MSMMLKTSKSTAMRCCHHSLFSCLNERYMMPPVMPSGMSRVNTVVMNAPSPSAHFIGMKKLDIAANENDTMPAVFLPVSASLNKGSLFSMRFINAKSIKKNMNLKNPICTRSFVRSMLG